VPKILIIEDEPEHIALVKLRLRACGYEVVSALTGAEGASAAALEEPDLVLMDLVLPDMDPAELVKRLHVACGAPVVAFTALDPFEISRRKLSQSFAGVIEKPYEPGELLAQIEKYLQAGP
jgi:two-component system KDP operon response regulator KdpE